ncbi:Bug family tripartite tricarboxylate transporter substrate binding protein [Ramlibacter sp.]|uniref:Bug family tripartite tricarboxylate transporter substrate binding protein n=1 Tax=Ramlibacter sp. TaxID=1917967 RepID=UPI003D1518C1
MSAGRRAFVAASILALGAAGGAAWGQGAYPSKTIRIVVPYAAGGSTDVLARMIGTHMAQAWGQPVVVDNRLGAGGAIGTEAVAKSPADGYTVLMAITAMIQAPALNPKLPYDPFKDFVPVSQVGFSQNLLLVPASLPANNVREFVALAKAPGKGLSFASFGNATSPHLYGELMNQRAGIRMVHVPYKGAALALNDLFAGQVDAVFVDMGSARPHLGSGKVKALAITGAQRASFLPDVPTMGESGYSGFEPNGWFGLFVPAGTPPEIVRKLSAETARIVRLPEVAERFAGLGINPLGSTSDEFAAVLRADAPKWAQIVKAANIKID